MCMYMCGDAGGRTRCCARIQIPRGHATAGYLGGRWAVSAGGRCPRIVVRSGCHATGVVVLGACATWEGTKLLSAVGMARLVL
jgi:hypothetical protein